MVEDEKNLSLWRRERERETGSAATKDNNCSVEDDVNFCAVGQCYRRRARQNFARFYTRIDWSSAREIPLLTHPCATLNCPLPRGAPSFISETVPDVDESERLRFRERIYISETGQIFIPLDDPKTKRLLSCQLSETRCGGGEWLAGRQTVREREKEKV